LTGSGGHESSDDVRLKAVMAEREKKYGAI
jgi:hypothetical protein